MCANTDEQDSSFTITLLKLDCPQLNHCPKKRWQESDPCWILGFELDRQGFLNFNVGEAVPPRDADPANGTG